MILLAAEQISKTYPEQVLFEDLTFGIHKGDKIALVANNGAGKSSLLKVLCRLEPPDEGQIIIRESVRLGYLPQDPGFSDTHTIAECIADAHQEIRTIVETYERALQEGDQKLIASSSTAMEVHNAWDYDRDLQSYLTRFGIHDTTLKIESLSGGQQKRLALALTLADKPDLLVMDEPTNHLDIAMIEWMEKHLSSAAITLFMVTHDRYFLDEVCNHIFELHEGKLYQHKGNYAYFLEKRAEREMIFDRVQEKAIKLLKQEIEWMRRMPQARTTKAKSRIDAFYELSDKASGRRRVDHLDLQIKMSRVGGKILELKNIHKSFGPLQLIKGFSYTFKKGDRVGIVGQNGVGKSTLLNIIMGLEKPDTGKINIGETTVFGYYHQDGLRVKESERIIDVVKNVAENIVMAGGTKVSASQFLQHFMFPPSVQYKPVSKLSGGEKRRLHLLMVLIKNPNFLILDEPTNDLDLLTLNKLEEFLQHYPGCLILVSHDRYFMDKLVDHLFIFTGDGSIRGYNDTYSSYRSANPLEITAPVITSKQGKSDISFTGTSEKKKRPSNREKNEFRKIEREINQMETRKLEIENTLSDPGLPMTTIEELSAEMAQILGQIEAKTERWMELADLFE